MLQEIKQGQRHILLNSPSHTVGPGKYDHTQFSTSKHAGYAPFGSLSSKKPNTSEAGLGPGQYNISTPIIRPSITKYENKNIIIVKVNDEIEIIGIKPTLKTTCTGVEMFRKLLDQGQAGDNVGILLRGTKREEVERGQVLAKPGSITPHTHFTAEVYILGKDEGGRHTPFFNNYRPQFYFRTTDVTGSIELPKDKEMVMPGDNVTITVKLIAPIAMEEGLRFAIREGGRTVGAGVVAKILA